MQTRNNLYKLESALLVASLFFLGELQPLARTENSLQALIPFGDYPDAKEAF